MSTKAVLSEYTIRLASESQSLEGIQAACVPWGHGMTHEQFLGVWNNFRKHDKWLTEGSVQTWVLVRRDDFEGTVYSFCLTYRRKSLLKPPGSDQIQEGHCYAISAVVTPEQHQRNGFAIHLMRLLHYHLASPSAIPPFPVSEWGPAPPPLSNEERKQVPPAIASMLCSAVGPTFYERATIGPQWPGWIVRDETCQRLSWKLFPPVASKEAEQRKWDWIYPHDLVGVGELLAKRKRKQLAAGYKDATSPIWAPDPSSTGTLSHVPSQLLRPRSEDWRTVYDTSPCGIRLPGIRAGEEEAIVIFTTSEQTIARGVLITYIDNLDAERLSVLLEALDEVGAKAGLEEGTIWGISQDSPLGQAWSALDGRLIKVGVRQESERGGNLLGVAWYGNPDGRGTLVDTQIWNWC